MTALDAACFGHRNTSLPGGFNGSLTGGSPGVLGHSRVRASQDCCERLLPTEKLRKSIVTLQIPASEVGIGSEAAVSFAEAPQRGVRGDRHRLSAHQPIRVATGKCPTVSSSSDTVQ